MSVTLTSHPSFKQYLIAECDAPSEETARVQVEAIARRANCEIVPESYAPPRAYTNVHIWFLWPLRAERAAGQTLARAA
jgi:hypothetical protein